MHFGKRETPFPTRLSQIIEVSHSSKSINYGSLNTEWVLSKGKGSFTRLHFNLARRHGFQTHFFFPSRFFGSLFSHGRKTLMKKGHNIPKMNDALEKLEFTSLLIPRLICTSHLRWRVRINSCVE
ncbi:hypothetical protein CDAR_591231 [Caerostris darwini]|uniref:Uncharacterized protein n=1 Tax=Caerostris darwini TaxID=1538125 RepID=A0AAV4RLR8_9ARAC|nr:hypothetical protein CDAR_591231 [Caerostris darwini]